MANKKTYEILSPEIVGIQAETLVLGKHSGKHALRDRLESMGFEVTPEQMEEIFVRFKKLADRKKTITSSDLEALVLNRRRVDNATYDFVSHVVTTGMGVPNTACIKLSRDGEEIQDVAIGTGPLDAAFQVINRLSGMDVTLTNFSLNAVTDGEDAIGEATVKLTCDGKSVTGRGLSTDIIESSIRAYVNGINKLLGGQ